MLKTAIAHSKELDSADAAEEVLEQCRETLGELQAHAGMLFAGIDHDCALILNKINEAYPGLEIIGPWICRRFPRPDPVPFRRNRVQKRSS